MSGQSALAKRQIQDVSSMPPPPTKRIKRPTTVLDEEDYTTALSDIIARDFFPGLAEVKAQEEYLSALDSKDNTWIREAGRSLKEAMTPLHNGRPRRTSRNTQFDTSKPWIERTPVPDTPRQNAGSTGGETPAMSIVSDAKSDQSTNKTVLDTANLSLSSFQAKYTSEDNESFNALLDKQNNTRRKKYAYLWTSDQTIPSDRLLTHRANQAKLHEAQSDHEALATKHNEKAMIPLTTGATSNRPASVESWTQKTPNNTLMSIPDTSVDQIGLQTVMEAKEALSKAGPKETVFANTRFPPRSQYANNDDDGDNDGRDSSQKIPPSPSLDTQIIAHRDLRRAHHSSTSSIPTDISVTENDGGETPRVNGYSFVDEDEPEPLSSQTPDPDLPTYRDLLAGQSSSTTPNPFTISEVRRREDLHFRLVAKEQAKKRREKEKDIERRRGLGNGNMTPAARKLAEKLGATPVHTGGGVQKQERMSSKEMWTPGVTPRRIKK